MKYHIVFIADGGSIRMKNIFTSFKRDLHSCVNNVDIFSVDEPTYNETYSQVENGAFSKRSEKDAEDEVETIRNRNKTRAEQPPKEKVDYIQHRRKPK